MNRRRILITGAGGFVGKYLSAMLVDHLNGAEIYSLPFRSNPPTNGLDVTNATNVDAAISSIQPSHVVHLAGLSTLSAAAADRETAWRVHVFGTLNLADAILRYAPECVLLFIGSGEVYGQSALPGHPLTEDDLLAPLSVYAATKAAADLAVGAMVRQGLRSIRMRPFNHTGPGQTDRFVVPSFAYQIAEIEKDLREPVIRVGNLSSERDFLDVRDVAAAYILAIKRSEHLASGTILNIASGQSVRIGAILDRLISLSGCRVTIESDPSRSRPSDVARYVGDGTRLRGMLNWTPSYSLDQTLYDVLEYYRSAVSRN